jgi:cytochrome c oxidase assembly factor CtaG
VRRSRRPRTGVLGALLTLSPRVWYPAYVSSAPALGIDPPRDRQLGGLLVWVPAGTAYLAAALAAAARLQRADDRRPAHGSIP